MASFKVVVCSSQNSDCDNVSSLNMVITLGSLLVNGGIISVRSEAYGFLKEFGLVCKVRDASICRLALVDSKFLVI